MFLRMKRIAPPARRVARIFRQGERPPENDLVAGTAAERMEIMWPLTLDAWSFLGEPVAPRLQRNIVRIVRGKR